MPKQYMGYSFNSRVNIKIGVALFLILGGVRFMRKLICLGSTVNWLVSKMFIILCSWWQSSSIHWAKLSSKLCSHLLGLLSSAMLCTAFSNINFVHHWNNGLEEVSGLLPIPIWSNHWTTKESTNTFLDTYPNLTDFIYESKDATSIFAWVDSSACVWSSLKIVWESNEQLNFLTSVLLLSVSNVMSKTA